MIKFQELVKDVWVFPRAEDEHNCAVVLGERGALLIDPDEHEISRRAVERFLDENGQAPVRAVIFTTAGERGDKNAWPGDVHVMGTGVPQNGVSLPDLVPGWEMLKLGEPGGDRVGVYHAGLKVLFCGDMLVDPRTGIPRLVKRETQGYLDALEQLEGLSVKLAVPLRGAPATGKRGIKARIEGDRNYITSLLRHVLSTQAANLPLERAITVASEIYEAFPHLDDHLANMRAVWTEMG
jgi:glyoxylase-like metal-dependent hydrolase (beta-lactamase superfamily II)